MKNIYRKLKDYIDVDESDGVTTITTIFGNLMSSECVYCFKNEETDQYTEYQYEGRSYGEMDFLLNYYVKGIHPFYKIKNDRIIPILRITLSKEI